MLQVYSPRIWTELLEVHKELHKVKTWPEKKKALILPYIIFAN